MDEFKQHLMQGEKSSLIRRVANENKALKEMSDQEVLSKQTEHVKLKELYKPITAATLDQTNKIEALFQQLRGKHDRLLSDIIRSVQRGTQETTRQGIDIVSAIVKQPLLPELIKELNNHPSLVKKIMQPGTIDISDLSDQNRKALDALNHLNAVDLRTLVQYYKLQQSKSEEELEEEYVPPTYSEIVFQDIAPDSSAYSEVIKTIKKQNLG